MSSIDKIKDEIAGAACASAEELEAFRIRFISRKSVIGDLFAQMKDIPAEKRKEYGQQINEAKNLAQEKFKAFVSSLEEGDTKIEAAPYDLTLPSAKGAMGSMHPITITRNRIIEIFEKIGFNVSDGPEIEDDWHNFTALNFPPNHPAREMQDTFFIEKNPDIALRTHTSSVQIRVMENQQPPIRTLCPGRVFRNEAISARAHCIFHQVEGFYVNENVSFVDLKQTLFHFAKEMFGKDTKVRYRPSYFPFTEPSAEIDISCNICKGDGCNVCKYTGWVEIAGSGMIDPNVLDNVGIDSEKYTGFAFGMGIERIAMLKWEINDLRLFTENDIRFLDQFKSF
jgi:phenylalanyl-tRNA synthetase alpha chain